MLFPPATKEAIKIIKEEKVVPLIWERGENLMKGFNKLVRNNDLIEFMEMVGYPCRPVVIFKENKQTDPLIMKSYPKNMKF